MKSTARKTTRKTARNQRAEDDPIFALVVDAFAEDRLVSRGTMFGSVALKVNGKVFAMLVKGRFVAKLPRAHVDELVVAGKGDYFDPGHGKPMREWVSIAAEQARWIGLAQEAYRFVKEASV